MAKIKDILSSNLILSFALAFALCSCSGNNDISGDKEVYITPLHSFFYNRQTGAATSLTHNDSIALQAFMKTVSNAAPSEESIDNWAGSRAVEVFTPDVDSVFSDTDNIQKALSHILANAGNLGLDLPERFYATVVYGRPESILFVDSVMLIALNHYLGEDYPGYSHWPTYMRTAKNPSALPYDIAEAVIATEHPFIRTDNSTLLSRLLYEGALCYVKMQLVDKATEAQALGYNQATLKWLNQNESNIWQTIVADQLLFETSESLADRFVSPAPGISALGPSVPGRAGRYIGLKIVESYLRKHPATTVTELLSPTFYDAPGTLAEAEYRP